MASETESATSGLPLDGSVVKMKGLPFKASPEDVVKFYQGFTLKTDNVYLKRHPDGRPNGEVRARQAVGCIAGAVGRQVHAAPDSPLQSRHVSHASGASDQPI
jgi:hypothetical protein